MAEAQRDEIAKLEALYAANPEGRVFTHLAEAYRKAGELERAKQILDEGLKRHPDSATAYVVLGRVAFDRAAQDEARTAFHRALQLDDGNLVAHRYLGELALFAGDRPEALHHFRVLLARNPSDESLRQAIQELTAEAPTPGDLPTLAEPEPELDTPVDEPSPESPASPFELEVDGLPGDLAEFAGRQQASRAGRDWEPPPPAPEESFDFALEESAGVGPEDAEPLSSLELEPLMDGAGTSAEPWSWGEGAPQEPLSAAGEGLPELGGESDTAMPGEISIESLAREEEGEGEWLDTELLEPLPGAGGIEAEAAGSEPLEADTGSGEPLLESAPLLASWPPALEEEPLAEFSDGLPELEPLAETPEPLPVLGETEPWGEEEEIGGAAADADALEPIPEEVFLEPFPTEGEEESWDAAGGEGDTGELLPPAAGIAPAGEEEPLEVEEGGFSAALGGAPGDAADDVLTETMAELYRTQGFHDRAADVYRSLLRRNPDDARLRERLAEVEAELTGTAPGTTFGSDMVAEEDEAGEVWLRDVEAASSGATASGSSPYAWDGSGEEGVAAAPPIGDYFRNLLGWTSGPPGEEPAETWSPADAARDPGMAPSGSEAVPAPGPVPTAAPEDGWRPLAEPSAEESWEPLREASPAAERAVELEGPSAAEGELLPGEPAADQELLLGEPAGDHELLLEEPAGDHELLLEEPAAAEGELLLEEPVAELAPPAEPEAEFEGWTPDQLAEPAAAPSPPAEPAQLMPWEVAEPPALSRPAPAPEAKVEEAPAAAEAAAESAEEDEDLEMFRSWLQSLKK